MFGYYPDLALRSLKRSLGLTALMVLSIGVGVALAAKAPAASVPSVACR